MPTGVILDALAVALGGLCGAFLTKRLGEESKNQLNRIFGLCSLSIGITAIVQMQNMTAVVLSIVLGTIFGIALRLEERITAAGAWLLRTVSREKEGLSGEFLTTLVLFCASGTGIYGAMTAGFTGDHSILTTKAILDFFTAAIFACSQGKAVSLVAIPQFVIFFLLYLGAGAIMPFVTDTMVLDFRACGGIIMAATGLRMSRIAPFPIGNMIPAMALVMPVSHLWTMLF